MSTACGLFLDGGSKVGWAVMEYDQAFALIAKGTFGTTSEGTGIYGYRLHVIDGRVQALIDKYRPARVGFESPWMPRGDTAKGNPMSARFLINVAGKFEEVAARNGFGADEISEVAPATAKLVLTGSGRLEGSTKEQKEQMKAACRRRGYEPADEHQADAIAVGIVCIDNYLRGRA